MNLFSPITVTNGGNGNDTLNGGSGRDAINGSNGDDSLTGGNGNDNLNGGNGNDILLGQVSNDNLVGDSGDDLLNGGLGDDTLLGGRGSDRFVLASSDGTDTISDFINGQDLIQLSAGLTFGQLTITQGTSTNANNTSIASSGELLAILAGVSTITSADFITV
jgi:Ca2+-binding RTX toxin-like protein